MGKEEFLKRLTYLLRDIPEEEMQDAVSYYRSYLEEAGPEREEEVLAGFGTPEQVAEACPAGRLFSAFGRADGCDAFGRHFSDRFGSVFCVSGLLAGHTFDWAGPPGIWRGMHPAVLLMAFLWLFPAVARQGNLGNICKERMTPEKKARPGTEE